jgi:drug/metabolite transporter (DMT)-like permease
MIFALLNALAVGLNGLAGGFASRKLGVPLVLAVAAPVSLVLALGALALEPSAPTMRGVVVGLVAGLTGGFGILMSYRALAIGPIGIASAVTGCTALTVASLWGFATQGGVSASRVLAVILCLLAVGMVSYRRTAGSLQLAATLLAIGAGVIFGFFQILMNATDESDGWWPLVMVRAGVVVIAWGFLVQQMRTRGLPERAGISRWVWVVPGIAGTMDSLGNILLIMALRVEDLAVVAVVTALTPAITAVLGWLVLSERLTRGQLVGLGVSVAALALAAL